MSKRKKRGAAGARDILQRSKEAARYRESQERDQLALESQMFVMKGTLFQAIAKIIAQLPYGQVAGAMDEMKECVKIEDYLAALDAEEDEDSSPEPDPDEPDEEPTAADVIDLAVESEAAE